VRNKNTLGCNDANVVNLKALLEIYNVNCVYSSPSYRTEVCMAQHHYLSHTALSPSPVDPSPKFNSKFEREFSG